MQQEKQQQQQLGLLMTQFSFFFCPHVAQIGYVHVFYPFTKEKKTSSPNLLWVMFINRYNEIGIWYLPAIVTLMGFFGLLVIKSRIFVIYQLL